jgi:hypothetical protein
MHHLPVGTVTLLFTDIEGVYPPAGATARALHRRAGGVSIPVAYRIPCV